MSSEIDDNWQPTWIPPPVGLLTIDCGNTTLDCLLRGLDGVERARLAHDDLEGLRARIDAASEVVGVSVVAAGLAGAERLAHASGTPMRVAGRELPCPLTLDYPEPETLGRDRWVSAFAAHRGFGGNCIVIDCGTAVTIDLVDAGGRFRGGMIAPGAGTMACGLRERAPALPAADLEAALRPVAVTSGDAVNAGVLTAFCGLIDRGVRVLAEGVGVDGPLLVITGGDAELYRRHGARPTQHVPDLVHRGLAELAATN